VEAIVKFPEPKDVKGLRRFLGMINFYHRFLPNIANIQASLREILKGQKKGNKSPVDWTTNRKTAFKKAKDELANATLLAFPDPSAQFAVQTDALGSLIGAVLQQRQDQGWRPLSFFFRRLTPAQCNYNAYNRELGNLRCSQTFPLHAGREKILRDYRSLTFAQKLDRASPRQCRQLTFISEFTTEIRHVPGEDNLVADALSRVDSIMMPVIVDTEELAQQQATDKELLRELESPSSSLKLRKFLLPETNSSLYCDCF